MVSEWHQLKIKLGIKVKDEGIDISFNDEQLQKKYSPKEITEEGITIFSRDEHLVKRRSSMDLIDEFVLIMCTGKNFLLLVL